MTALGLLGYVSTSLNGLEEKRFCLFSNIPFYSEENTPNMTYQLDGVFRVLCNVTFTPTYCVLHDCEIDPVWSH